MKQKISAIFAVVLFVLTALTFSACSKKTDAEVYFLNFKPEVADVFEDVAKAYQEETGIAVKVVTAASGTYESTLKSEIAKKNAPTIFIFNGAVGYSSWKDYCLDLTDSTLASKLVSDNYAMRGSDGRIYGLAAVVEGYGIITNNAILKHYFSLADRQTAVNSLEEIRNFESLKIVVEDMTAHKEVLGIDGVFAATSMSAGEQWRWQSHLANVPFYYEFLSGTGSLSPTQIGLEAKNVEFLYNQNFRNLFDLYLNNSTTAPTLLGSKSTADAMAEFALGKAAMVQNGNWSWAQIDGVDGNVVEEDDLGMLPLYTGIPGEESQGICIGTENYLAVNRNVSEEKQKAALDFLEWLYTSKTGKDYVINKLEFIAPYTSFTETEKPDDPLARAVDTWMNRDDIENIPWVFEAFPSDNFKNEFGSALLEYAQGSKTWDETTTTVTDSWKKERS